MHSHQIRASHQLSSWGNYFVILSTVWIHSLSIRKTLRLNYRPTMSTWVVLTSKLWRRYWICLDLNALSVPSLDSTSVLRSAAIPERCSVGIVTKMSIFCIAPTSYQCCLWLAKESSVATNSFSRDSKGWSKWQTREWFISKRIYMNNSAALSSTVNWSRSYRFVYKGRRRSIGTQSYPDSSQGLHRLPINQLT